MGDRLPLQTQPASYAKSVTCRQLRPIDIDGRCRSQPGFTAQQASQARAHRTSSTSHARLETRGARHRECCWRRLFPSPSLTFSMGPTLRQFRLLDFGVNGLPKSIEPMLYVFSLCILTVERIGGGTRMQDAVARSAPDGAEGIA